MTFQYRDAYGRVLTADHDLDDNDNPMAVLWSRGEYGVSVPVRIPADRVEEVIAGIRDAARTAAAFEATVDSRTAPKAASNGAARQATGQDDTDCPACGDTGACNGGPCAHPDAAPAVGQDDTESCVDCEHPKKLHNQRGCNGHWGPEEGCTCSHTNTGHTACKGATVCGENDELCDQHEREQAHAEGEHAFCGEECECTCAAAGPEFVPAGHYRDCPHYVAPAVGQPAKAQDADRASARCSSCEHGLDIHDADGRCWFTVQQGVPDRDLVCSCKLRRMAEEARS